VYTVINNRVYNTDTAKKIAEYKHNGVTETLYRKKTGEYFAHFYNAKADDTNKAGWHGKEKIAPYDYETARAWAEISLDKGLYRELFDGEAETDEGAVIPVRISKKALAKLKKYQSQTGESIGRALERAIGTL
jgi:hypothetical protein